MEIFGTPLFIIHIYIYLQKDRDTGLFWKDDVFGKNVS